MGAQFIRKAGPQTNMGYIIICLYGANVEGRSGVGPGN